jgi:hypothetical protein
MNSPTNAARINARTNCGIKIVDGLGTKIQSSSDLVKKFKAQQKTK